MNAKNGPAITLEGKAILIKEFTFCMYNAFIFLNIDLYRDGGFDGDNAYFFILLAEDEGIKNSDGFVVLNSPSKNTFLMNKYLDHRLRLDIRCALSCTHGTVKQFS